MKINFKIENTPIGDQKKYPTAYLEGILSIFFNDILFFSQSEILLIEFAIFINSWLKRIQKGEIVNFDFETMDNDESILSLNYVEENFYKIHSIWQEVEATESLTKEEIVVEFKRFLINLDNELKLKTDIDLNSILNDSQL